MVFGNDEDISVENIASAGGERQLLSAQFGIRAKAQRLIIKQKFGRDELKSDILPPPPLGKSIGHGLLEDNSFFNIE